MIVGVFFIWHKATSTTLHDSIRLYEEKWGIQLPLPEKREDIWHSKASFHGDGEWITIFHYNSDNLQMQHSGMTLLTEANLEIAKSRIEHFLSTTTSLYADKEAAKLKTLFEQNAVEVQAGDYYFYKSKNGGNDYFIAVYKVTSQKLFTFEWHQ